MVMRTKTATLGLKLVAIAILSGAPIAVQARGEANTAVLAGGCYWGLESVFDHVKGVREVVSGFAGASPLALTRSGAESDQTVEAVRIIFDPGQVSYRQLLDVFFEVAHDPTQVNRQGPDVGSRYRSAIFPQTPEQRAEAMRYLADLRASGKFRRPIATRLETGRFESADSTQQHYVENHPREPYVVVNDLPKLAALKQSHPELWRP